ncbi:MAG: WhiB family transcriptional regulator [Actinobacteria bacterium]|nr:WhiB family transcriptional regulator [Actinomycetota bacterium]
MQWRGTSGVLEGRADVTSGGELTGLGLSAFGLSSQVFGTAELPCRNDPELFFAESPDDVEFAKSLCGGCAVRAACLAGAIARAEPWGVWGGELFLRGEIVPRKRPRGRPRKEAVAA